ncbi:MAG: phosphoglycerate mutase family protein [Phycisphaerales bacterium]
MRHAITMSVLFVCALVLAAAGGLSGNREPEDARATTYILVRHAEKVDDGTQDPGLTEAGRARGERLASMLRSMGVVGVYTSGYERTRATGAPIAAMAGVPVQTYDPRDPTGSIEEIRKAHEGGAVVIVGHSNTIPDLVRRLGGDCEARTLAEDAYDDVFVVTVLEDGRVLTHHLHS